MSETGKAVFLSYASQDAEAVARLAEALRASGVEVWFDRNELVGGDAWDAKIRRQIKACALFVPVISASTQARAEGYFRREWKLAVERTRDMADHVAFLLPVVIDGTKDAEAFVPEKFREVQWTRLRPGDGESAAPLKAFCGRVAALLSGTPTGAAHRPEGGAEGSPAGPRAGHLGRARGVWRRPGLLLGMALLAGAVLALGIWRPWSRPAVVSVPPPPPPVPDRRSLAVLPFESLSADKENEFFAAGVHEDLLSNLAGIGGLRVVSRTSVLPYREARKSIPQIGRELGVAYVLEGTVRRAGNRVRVTGQLIKADVEDRVWSKTYERELSDVFSIQSALANEIAAALQTALTPLEQRRLARPPTENLPAYQMFLRSRDPQYRRRSPAAWLSWREMWLRRATELDPGFALAWVHLANTHTMAHHLGFDTRRGRIDRAEEALRRAEELQPELPEVTLERGYFRFAARRDLAGARRDFERLIQLLPNHAEAHARLADVAWEEGRWNEAVDALRAARRLDRAAPEHARSLAQFLLALRRYDEAADVQREVAALLPQEPAEILKLHSIAFLALGSTREIEEWLGRGDAEAMAPVRLTWAEMRGDARAIVRQGMPDTPLGRVADTVMGWLGRPPNLAGLEAGLALRALGRTRESVDCLHAHRAILLRRLRPGIPDSHGWTELALTHALLGDGPAARAALARADGMVPETGVEATRPARLTLRAAALAWLGEAETVLSELTALLRHPGGLNVHVLRHGLRWAPLHGRPDFEALLNDPANNAPFP